MTLAITPKATTNTLLIHANIYLSSTAATTNLIVALFQDSTANALAVADNFQNTASAELMLPLTYSMAAGTVSSTTFKIRGGASGAGTTTFNGDGGSRFFNTAIKSSLTITEYKS